MPIIHTVHKGLEAALTEVDETQAIYAIGESDSVHIYTVLMALHEVETLEELLSIPAVEQISQTPIKNATSFFCNVTINGVETIGALTFETIDGSTVKAARIQTKITNGLDIKANGIYHVNVDFERHY